MQSPQHAAQLGMPFGIDWTGLCMPERAFCNLLSCGECDAGPEAEDWDAQVQEAKDAVNFQASAMATAYGKELNVGTDDILWGMGQVTSCYTRLHAD